MRIDINKEGVPSIRGETINLPPSVFQMGSKEFNLNVVQSAFASNYNGGCAIVSSSTGTGKTICAHIAIKRAKRFVYVVPTKSLANQIYREIAQYRSDVCVKTGDISQASKGSVVCTLDVFVTAVRNKVSWTLNRDLIVIDEGHFLMDNFKERSLFLEEATGYCLSKNIPVLLLSATFPGLDGLQRWVKPALMVVGHWRPIKLERVVLPREKDIPPFDFVWDIISGFKNGEKIMIVPGFKSHGWAWLKKFVEKGLPVLNEELPSSSPSLVMPSLRFSGKSGWSKEIRAANKQLLQSAPPAVAFHNADIPAEDKAKIEASFGSPDGIRFLLCTHTLAYGYNSGTDVVITCPTMIKKDGKWSLFPAAIDIIQFEGRAGRPGHSKTGKATSIIVCHKAHMDFCQNELRECLDREFNTTIGAAISNGECENITGYVMLGALSLTDGNLADALSHIEHLYKGKDMLDVIDETLAFLYEGGLVCGNYSLTDEGRAVASSCIYPKDYFHVRASLERIHDVKEYRHADERWFDIISAVKPLIRQSFKVATDLLHDGVRAAYKVFTETHGFDEKSEIPMLLFYCMGGFHKGKLPGNFSGTYHNTVTRLAGFLAEMSVKGYLAITPEEVMRVANSLISGIHPLYSLVSGVGSIGPVRGHLLAFVGSRIGCKTDLMLFNAAKTLPQSLLDECKKLDPKTHYIKEADIAVKKLIDNAASFNRLLGNKKILMSMSSGVFGFNRESYQDAAGYWESVVAGKNNLRGG